MSTLALQRLQQAIYTRLSGDGVLMGLVSAIHDSVPENAGYPFVVIGDGTQQAIVADAELGDICSLQIFSYSQQAGRRETHTILDRIYGLLNFTTLTLSAGELLSMRVEKAEAKLMPQNGIVQGELRLAAVITA